MLEVKEGLKPSARRDVLARISVPRFFRRYIMLAGACANAGGIEGEIRQVYGLLAERFPVASRVPVGYRVFRDGARKRQVLAQSVARASEAGYAVVVGMRSPREAKAVLDELERQGVKVSLLQPPTEPQESIAITSGAVLLTVHPAERNVQVPASVPLRLFIGELHDAARQVASLGRIFGAESCEHLIALDEELVMAHFGMAERAALAFGAYEEVPKRMSSWLTGRVQRSVERSLAGARAELMAVERYLKEVLAFSGARD
jgi:preprotein translocase subunit SecA